ncbi:hypothetical protein ACTFIV_003180 [Dictyostelium citrinum]
MEGIKNLPSMTRYPSSFGYDPAHPDHHSVPSSKRDTDDSDTEDEDREERTDTDSVPTDYQLSDTLLDQYQVLINNQGLLVEEECILKKSEISEMNKVFSFPSNLQVNVAPFGTPEGITASSNLKNNDADLFIVENGLCTGLKFGSTWTFNPLTTS